MPCEWYCGYVAYLVRVCARLDVPDDAADMLSDARGTSREHVPTLFFIALHLRLRRVLWIVVDNRDLAPLNAITLGASAFGGMPLVREARAN